MSVFCMFWKRANARQLRLCAPRVPHTRLREKGRVSETD